MFYGEHLSRKEYESQGGELEPIEPAELCKEPENRRCGVPDRELLFRDERAEAKRLLPDVVSDEHESAAVLDRKKEIENGEIEVKRSMRRESVILGGTERVGAPVDK
jgi:hypothetical protein